MILSFRTKTILGIALIEAVLLSILIYSVMHFLRVSNESQFSSHVETTSNIFTTLIRDEVLALDMAKLDSAVTLLGRNPGVSFVRILDSQERVLAQAGSVNKLAQPFAVSRDLNDTTDGIYRMVSPIRVADADFALVQFGFDAGFMQQTFATARQWSIAIALFEMSLVAIFSMVLGTYLTRQIGRFTAGTQRISSGELGLQLPVLGYDEIARATQAFNTMSLAIKAAHDSLEDEVKERTSELEQSNHRLRHLLDERSILLNSQSVGLMTMQGKKVLWANHTFLKMMGFSSLAEIRGKTARRYYARQEDFVTVGQSCRANGALTWLEHDFEFVRADGQPIWIDLSGSRLPIEGQTLWVIVDVTQRVQSQTALRRSENKFRSLFEATSEAILILDGDRFVDCNTSAIRMFGARSKEQICQLAPESLSPASQPCGTESIILSRKWVERAYAEGSVRYEWIHKRLDSQQSFAAEVMLSLVPYDDHKVLLSVVWDISERQAMIEKIRQQANYDYLTGMCNRRYFLDLAERELERARRYHNSLAVLGIDIDFFKRINDTYGHKAGDLALQKFAAICQEVVRHTDLTGRLGGEEFAILLPDTDMGRACEIAERLRKEVEEAELILPDNKAMLNFTISVGLTLLAPGEDVSIDLLLQRADTALYRAKKSGRNQVISSLGLCA